MIKGKGNLMSNEDAERLRLTFNERMYYFLTVMLAHKWTFELEEIQVNVYQEEVKSLSPFEVGV